jgi:hypothetical protein
LTPEEYTEKKNKSIIKTFEKIKGNRFKYSFLQSLYFAFLLSIISEAFEGFKDLFSIQFLFKFLSSFILYFLYSYYLTFRSLKKNYEKIIKKY